MNLNLQELIQTYIHLIDKKLELYPEEMLSTKILKLLNANLINPEFIIPKGYGFKVMEIYQKRNNFNALPLKTPQEFYGNLDSLNLGAFNNEEEIQYIIADIYTISVILTLNLQTILQSWNLPIPYTNLKLPINKVLQDKIQRDTTVLVDAYWRTRIYLGYRIITDLQVNINSNILGSDIAITPIAPSNTNWSSNTNDPIVCLMESIELMKQRDYLFRALGFKPKFVMSWNTFMKFFNNSNVREFYKNYDISAFENLIQFSNLDINAPINELAILGKGIEIIIINDKITNPNTQNLENAIPDNKVFVFYDIPNNVSIYGMIPPYLDENNKVVIKSGEYELKEIRKPVPMKGIIELLFISGLSAIVKEPKAFAYFNIT